MIETKAETNTQFYSKEYNVRILGCKGVPPTTPLKDSDPGPIRGLWKHDNFEVPHMSLNLDQPPTRIDTSPPLPAETVTPTSDVDEFRSSPDLFCQ